MQHPMSPDAGVIKELCSFMHDTDSRQSLRTGAGLLVQGSVNSFPARLV